ncbi:MAG: leucine-rich repeat protein [Lachnospiraceae bacterium]|nr:leucine-rich repeat protein [Lachnospiraceae bacterium]
MVIKRIYYSDNGIFKIPNNVSEISNEAAAFDTTVKTIGLGQQSIKFGGKAFYQTSVEKVCGLDGNKELDAKMFLTDEAQSLKNEADNTIEIHTESFSKCTKLHTVIIPKTKRIIIESFAFSGCCNLRSFEIQADDIEISDSAFEGCPNLTLISNCDFVERFSREHGIRFLRI